MHMKEVIEWHIFTCAHQGCHALYAVPDSVDNRLRETKETFYCPFGHSQVYGGSTEVQRLKREIENQRSLINRQETEIRELKKPKRKPRKKAVKKKTS